MTEHGTQIGLVLDCAASPASPLRPTGSSPSAPPRSAKHPAAEHGSSWLLMTDPEGTEFCVCDGRQSQPR